MSAAEDLFAFAAQLPADDDAPPAWLPTRAQRAAARQRDYERLEPVALALAERVGPHGFTADDLRAAAIEASVLTGEEGKATGQQRALSWFGPFLTSLARRGAITARTYPDGQKVRRASARDEANGNLQVVYVSNQYARTGG